MPDYDYKRLFEAAFLADLAYLDLDANSEDDILLRLSLRYTDAFIEFFQTHFYVAATLYNTFSGYDGAILQSKDDPNQFYLLNRGTETDYESWEDILAASLDFLADVQIGVSGEPDSQLEEMLLFYANFSQGVLVQNQDAPELTVVGHSLGGYLSTYFTLLATDPALSTEFSSLPLKHTYSVNGAGINPYIDTEAWADFVARAGTPEGAVTVTGEVSRLAREYLAYAKSQIDNTLDAVLLGGIVEAPVYQRSITYLLNADGRELVPTANTIFGEPVYFATESTGSLEAHSAANLLNATLSYYMLNTLDSSLRHYDISLILESGHKVDALDQDTVFASLYSFLGGTFVPSTDPNSEGGVSAFREAALRLVNAIEKDHSILGPEVPEPNWAELRIVSLASLTFTEIMEMLENPASHFNDAGAAQLLQYAVIKNIPFVIDNLSLVNPDYQASLGVNFDDPDSKYHFDALDETSRLVWEANVRRFVHAMDEQQKGFNEELESLLGSTHFNVIASGEDNAPTGALYESEQWHGDEQSNTIQTGDKGAAVFAGTGDDHVTGGAGDDVLVLEGGADIGAGGAGHDRIYGGRGNDILIGGAGHDELRGGEGADTYRYTPGDGYDVLEDDGVEDRIEIDGVLLSAVTPVNVHTSHLYEDGAHRYWVNGTSLFIFVNALNADAQPNDVIEIRNWDAQAASWGITVGEAPVRSQPTADAEQIVVGQTWTAPDGSTGSDFDGHYQNRQAWMNDRSIAYSAQEHYSTGGYLESDGFTYYLQGGDRNDQLTGGDRWDRLDGRGGDDFIDLRSAPTDGSSVIDIAFGGSGSDYLLGGDGGDWVWGSGLVQFDTSGFAHWEQGNNDQDFFDAGAGNDFFSGGSFSDIAIGGLGNDRLFGGAGADQISGDSGDDELLGDSVGWLYLGGTPEQPQLVASPHFVTDVVAGERYDDVLDGGDGDDQLWGELGNDVLFGGNGADILLGDRLNDPGTVVNGGAGATALLYDDYQALNPVLHGSDALYGGDGNDTLYGNGGNDLLDGGAGDDYLHGDDEYIDIALHGDDHLTGGDGDDQILGGGGQDRINAGSGNDVVFGDLGDDDIHGGDGNDFLYGDNSSTDSALHGNDRLYGGAGADQLVGHGGDDDLHGGNDDDVLFGDAGNDQLYGDEGADQLVGGTGDDRLDGGAGNDLLWGQEGSDRITGGPGDDVVQAGSGDDYLFGSAGDDTLYGEAGDDTYIFETGDGTDTIIDTQGLTRIQFNGFIFRETIRIEQDDISATIHYGPDVNDQIVMSNAAFATVESIRLVDGTLFPVEVLMPEAGGTFHGSAGADTIAAVSGSTTLNGNDGSDLIVGGTGNDRIYGDAGNDVLSGHDGNDVLHGGSGDDFFDPGAGSDTLYGDAGNDVFLLDYNYGVNTLRADFSGFDILALASGITAEDVEVRLLNGDRLQVYLRGEHTLYQVYDYAANQGALDSIQFLDDPDTVWDAADFHSMFFTGSESRDRIWADVSNPEIHGLGGDDLIYGSVSGSQVADRLYGEDGDDHLIGWDGDDLLVGGNGSDQLSGGDGHDQLYGEAGNDALVGGSGNDVMIAGQGDDTLYGDLGDDHLDGESGNDTLLGGYGADTYVFGIGYGTDTVRFDADNVSSDSYAIRAGITAADLWLGWTTEDLLELQIKGTADRLLLEQAIVGGQFNDEYALDRVQFADGTSLSLGELYAMRTAATDGDDVLQGDRSDEVIRGLAGNDVLDGSAGNDLLDGGAGNDVYRFGMGYGVDTIESQDKTAGRVDIVEMQTGISAEDVQVYRSGDDLWLWLSASDRLTVLGHFVSKGKDTGYHIDAVHFEDGTVWSYADLASMATEAPLIRKKVYGTDAPELLVGTEDAEELYGFAGNDTLYAAGGDDILVGGPGNDVLDGGAGNDIYRYGLGDQADTITAQDTSSGRVDVIEFTGGISKTDIRIVREGDDLILDIPNEASQELRVTNHFVSKGKDAGYHIDEVRFEDGSTWTRDDFDYYTSLNTFGHYSWFGSEADDVLSGFGGRDFMYGYGGNDTLIGGRHGDIFYGGTGDDLMVGGWGADRYEFSSGFGIDVIDNYDSDPDFDAYDSIRFDESVNVSELRLFRAGDDLQLALDALNMITVLNHFVPGESWSPWAIDGIHFADGTIWTEADIAELAMVRAAPEPVDDVAQLQEDLPLIIHFDELLANDLDANGDVLTVTAVLQPGFGAVHTDYAARTITYTPLADFSGMDQFEYTVSDGFDERTAAVQLSVQAVNDAPQAVEDQYLTTTNTMLVLGVAELLSNDFDVDGDELVLTSISGASNGTVDYDFEQQTITFTPDTDFEGLAAFDYSISDGELVMTATVDISVRPPNTAPNVADDACSTLQEAAIVIAIEDLLANDMDADGDLLYLDHVLDVRNGQLVHDAGQGTLTFAPDPWFVGQASFDYVVSDGVDAARGTVLIEVAPDTSVTGVVVGTDAADSLRGGSGADRLYGMAGDDVLTGGRGNDELYAGSGNDLMEGGVGDDVYIFSVDDEIDLIDNSTSHKNDVDILRIVGETDHEHLWFSRTGDDLVIDIVGSNDALTVGSWFADEQNQLEEIRVDDMLLDPNGVDQLVAAMSGYAVPEGEGVEIDPAIRTELLPEIQAAWQLST